MTIESTSRQSDESPTVVLVHGAFADASCWNGVVRQLQAAGITTLAPANPLRGIAYDAAYIASVVNALTGPVLLVGHSYGGAIITNAGTQTPNAIGLVYVAAFAPDEGEVLQSILTRFPTELGEALKPATVPVRNASAPEVEFSIDPAAFHAVFTGDLSAEDSAMMAATQRPIAGGAFGEPSGVPAWRALPSWYAVATGDHAINPDAERFMASRAGAATIELDGSHVVMVSQPSNVAALIQTAISETSRTGVPA